MNEAQRTKLRTQLSQMLNRTMQSLPLPLPEDDIYRACFPGHAPLAKALLDVTALDAPNAAMANLMRLVDSGSVVSYRLDQGTDENFCQTFWVQHNRLLAAGPKALYVADVEVNRLLTAWWERFNEHERFIDASTYDLYQVVKLLTSRHELEAAWPELLQAVPSVLDSIPTLDVRHAVVGARVARRSIHLRRELDKLIPPESRERIVELLATAVLLPDSKPNCGIATRGPN